MPAEPPTLPAAEGYQSRPAPGGPADAGAYHGEAATVRGSWERDPSHFPLPVTPSFASLYLRWQEAAFAAMFAEFGYLAGGLRSRLIDGYLYLRVVPAGGWAPPPWAAGPLVRLWWAHPRLRERVRRSVERLRSGYPEQVLRRWEREWRPRVEAELREALAADPAALDGAGLLRHFDTVCRRAGEHVRMHFVLHGAIAPAMARLEFLCRDTPELAGVRPADMLIGLSRESSAPGRALRGLAAYLRARPSLLGDATRLGAADFLAALERLDSGLARRFRAWIDAYGHRITSRYEFIEPALAEQPARVMALVLGLAAHPAPAEDDEARLTRARDEAAAAARARLRDAERRRRFDEALAAARRAYPVRDDNVVLTFNASFAMVRYALLEIGRRWQGRFLERRDDIFFLTAEEVREGLASPSAAFAAGPALHAAARRRTWEGQLAAPPPPVHIGPQAPIPPLDALPPEARFMNAAIVWYMRGIQSLAADLSPQPPPLKGRGSSVNDRAPCAPFPRRALRGDRGGPADLQGGRGGRSGLRGIAAVPGHYTGTARVILGEPDFDRLRDGDVLVCPMTSPAWSALFPRVGALVTDHGGVLSHPAVIAREFGIPAVVATRDGTARIPDGALVTVDGGAGTVTFGELPGTSAAPGHAEPAPHAG